MGERAARKHLQKHGLKFLTANFRSARIGHIHTIILNLETLRLNEFQAASQRAVELPHKRAARLEYADALVARIAHIK